MNAEQYANQVRDYHLALSRRAGEVSAERGHKLILHQAIGDDLHTELLLSGGPYRFLLHLQGDEVTQLDFPDREADLFLSNVLYVLSGDESRARDRLRCLLEDRTIIPKGIADTVIDGLHKIIYGGPVYEDIPS